MWVGVGFRRGFFLVHLLVKCIGMPTIKKNQCSYNKEAIMHIKKIDEPIVKEPQCDYTKDDHRCTYTKDEQQWTYTNNEN